MSQHPVELPARKPIGPQAVEPSRKAVKRLHQVPGTVPAGIRALIVSELRGGRSAVQVGKEYGVVVGVVLEFFVRDVERRVMARAA